MKMEIKIATAVLAAGWFIFAATGFAVLSSAVSASSPVPPPAADIPLLPAAAGFGRVPPHFIRNDGQIAPEVRYYRKGPRGTVYLTDDELVFDFVSGRPGDRDHRPPGEPPEAEGEENALSRLVFRLRFLNSEPGTAVEGREELPGKINYFIGSRENWRTAIPTFEEVAYRDLYPGIDLSCRFVEGNLAYRFTVSPGADPGQIAFRYSGVEGLEINPAGDLIALTPLGGFRTPAPRAHQEFDGRRADRKVSFTLRNETTVALDVADRDPAHALVVEF